MAITFRENPALRMLGRRVNAEEWNGISRTLEGDVTVGFAEPVVAGAGPRGALPLTAAGQNILGITEANQVLPRPGDWFEEYDTMPVTEVGVIGVQLGAAVVKDAQARWNVTAKRWTSAAASATVLTVPGATFDEAGVADDVVALRYRRQGNPSLSA